MNIAFPNFAFLMPPWVRESYTRLSSDLGDCIAESYGHVDLQSRRLLDPVISRFRERFPRSGSGIGASLADRLFLFVVTIFILFATLKIVSLPVRLLLGPKKRSRVKRPFISVAGLRTNQEIGDCPFKTPLGSSSKAQVLRTSKKKIVHE